MRRIALIAAVLLLAAPLAACGDDAEEGGSDLVPAAGENTPPAGTPGVPEGASYDADGNRWLNLDRSERVEAATDYVADNEEICAGADPERVADYADVSVGTDFPLTAPVADVLSEGCAAELQS